MAAKGPRENITLECTDCKRRNYITSKNKRHNTERLELVKFCKYCNKKNDTKSIEKNKSDVATIGNELKKVSWPSAGELSKATASVVFLVIIVALIIFLSDSLFSLGFKKVTGPIIERQKKEQNIGTNTSNNEKNKIEEKKSEENKEDKKEENKEDKKEENKEQQ